MSTSIPSHFPYTKPKPDQQKIFDVINDHQSSIIHLPTGTGKTIASLSALLDLFTSKTKLYIFVRTISQINPILRECTKIRQNNNSGVKTMLYLGRGLQCGSTCFEEHRRQSIFHKRNWKKQLRKLNQKMDKAPTVSTFLKFTQLDNVCSREYIENFLPHAQIIVTTHPYLRNHYFKKLLRLTQCKLENSMILVDEAHNLTQNFEYSTVNNSEIQFWSTLFPDEPFFQNMLEIRKHRLNGRFPDELKQYNVRPLIKTLQKIKPSKNQEVIDRMITFLELLDWGFILYIQNEGFVIVGTYPKGYLQKFAKAKRQVYQSATFYTTNVTRKMFGLSADVGVAELNLYYHKPMGKRYKAFLLNSTSQKQYRNRYTYASMAKTIEELFLTSPRHVLVLFSSYEYIQEVLPYFSQDLLNHSIVETEDTTLDELKSYLFTKNSPHLLLANQRGKVLEGVEWVKDGTSLVSLVIMAGLATYVPHDNEAVNHTIRFSYNKLGMSSKTQIEFMELYPLYLIGQQAFGRAIRNERDCAAFILIDHRAQKYLVNQFQLGWGVSTKKLTSSLINFFKDYQPLDKVLSFLDIMFY